MVTRWLFVVTADFPDDVTREQVENVLADAVVQIAEPVLERRDDGNDVEGTATIVTASVIETRE